MPTETEICLENIKQKLSETIYFYSSTLPNGFLSNFYPSSLLIDDKLYYHVEGYYQSQKFIDIDDNLAELIRNERSPVLCKKMATQNTRTKEQEENWNSGLKVLIMKRALLTKFTSNSTLASMLLNTGDKELIEDSKTDYYWGCGRNGSGENMLGKLLMEVRLSLNNVYKSWS